MSDQNYRKPLLLTLTGAVALTAAFYAFRQYRNQSHDGPEHASSLHRSNAIRRPRGGSRQARSRYQPILDYDPIARAIRHLQHRNRTREGYGQYFNTWFFRTPEARQGLDLTLIPCNLNSIFDYLVQNCQGNLSEEQRTCLRFHVYGLFLQNFLKEELPEGFKIGEDAFILASALEHLEVDAVMVHGFVKVFDTGDLIGINYDPFTEPENTPRPDLAQMDGATEAGQVPPREILQALVETPNNEDDSDSYMSFGDNEEDPGGSQNMLDLLYHIAAEQSRREGYIHRGVECNSCGVHPIYGIRYHCANCFDFDLCEACEASTLHVKSHVFYKIRIPAPSRGNVKQVTPKWYPGNPDAFSTSLPSEVSKPLLLETRMDRTEMDALYEQFKCIAGHYFPSDPTGLGVAIDRKGFDAYFIASHGDRPSAANLIYDRIFAFYDVDRNGLITFDEFVRGLSRLQEKTRSTRLKRVFDGYDLDGDSYVDRKDFLRMFRAYYALSKELSWEMINTQGEFGYREEELQETVQGSQPISAVFGGGELFGHASRTGQDKQPRPDGDLQLANGSTGVLQNDTDMRGDRTRAIGNAALGDRTRNHPFRSFRREPMGDEPVMMVPGYGDYANSGMEPEEIPEEEMSGPDASLQNYPWPPLLSPLPEDVSDALGQQVPLEEITDPVDRTRVLYAQSQRIDAAADRVEEAGRDFAVNERWRRRQFYLDEEEGFTQPPGYIEPDSSEDEDDQQGAKKRASPRRASMASRSSSKVRFDDSAIDTDYETRSNASSRSIPMNERWGGYELSQAEEDIGKDILYQAVQQGFNQLLDALFKDKEEAWLAAQQTRHHRRVFHKEWRAFEKLLLRDAELDDRKESVELELLTCKDDKEEARHVATGMIDHLKDQDEPDLASSAAAGLDSDDHIGLMFGSQPSVRETMINGTENGAAGEDYRDPTLPQFRPDEADVTASSSHADRFRLESSTQVHSIEEHPSASVNDPVRNHFDQVEPEDSGPSSSASKGVNPFAGPHMRARATCYLWLRHELIDRESKRRGGGGKLSFGEFRRKMVPEDEVSAALGDKNKGQDEDEEVRTWESTADMGKLAFVGTWLQMASF